MISKTLRKYTNERFNRLIKMDTIRRYRLLEIVQYTTFYMMLTLAIAPRLDELFPTLDEKKAYSTILFESILQIVIVSICIFYVKKIVKLIPPIGLLLNPSFVVGTTQEYHGEMVMGLVLVHAQKKLASKIHYLVHNFSAGAYIWSSIPRLNA